MPTKLSAILPTPFSNYSKARLLDLQVARLTGVGRELTSKWFSSQALFFLKSHLFSSILYINNLTWLSSLSYVVQFCFSLNSTDFNKGGKPVVAWRTSEFWND